MVVLEQVADYSRLSTQSIVIQLSNRKTLKQMKAMNRKNRSIFASLVVLALFGVLGGCRETPITSKPNIPTVFVGEINGVVRDGSTGAPLNNVTVTLLGTATDAGGANPQTTTTDANGLYVFRNLDAGTYKIAATAPTGYAATRVLDGVELEPRTGTNESGVVVTRVARDIRFFTANAVVRGLLTYQTPGGQLLPVPAGTPVFVDFALTDGESPAGRTVGDVQVSLVPAVTGSVRDTLGAQANLVISGLPAVGALADAGETPRLLIPNFTINGITYGGNNGRAITVNLTGLRSGTSLAIQPNQLIAQPNIGPTRIAATNLNSVTNFPTTAFQGTGGDTAMIVVFNKPVNPSRTIFSLRRVRTPYDRLTIGQIGSTTDGTLLATPLAAGTYLGQVAAANQAFRIQFTRPLVTGTDHEIEVTEAVGADGRAYENPLLGVNDQNTRRFTTRSGIRLLSVVAGGVTLAPGLNPTTGVPTSGNLVFTFDVPSGASIAGINSGAASATNAAIVTRGAFRNVELREGTTLDAGTLQDEFVPAASGTTSRIDSAGVTDQTARTITLAYRSIPTATAATDGRTGNRRPFHIASVPSTVTNDVARVDRGGQFLIPATIRSTVLGDFGVGRTAAAPGDDSYSLLRLFEATATVSSPIQLTSFTQAGDSITVVFNRAIRGSNPVTNLGTTGGAFVSGFRLQRGRPTATATSTGPYDFNSRPSSDRNPFGLTLSNVAIFVRWQSDSIAVITRTNRTSDGSRLPLEAGTTHTLEVGLGVASGTGQTVSTTNPIRWYFEPARGISFAGTVPSNGSVGSDTVGTLRVNFSLPIRPGTVIRTRGVGRNVQLVKVVGSVETEVLPSQVDETGTVDGSGFTLGFRNLERNTTYRIKSLSVLNTTVLSGDSSSININGATISDALKNSIIRADNPADLGVGATAQGYSATTGNVIESTFRTRGVEPVTIESATVSGRTDFGTTEAITVTFSKPMVPSATGIILRRVATPFSYAGLDVSSSTTTAANSADLNLDTQRGLLWSNNNRTVQVRRQVLGGLGANPGADTTAPLETGSTYNLIFNTSVLQASDGGELIGATPLLFSTPAGIRLTNIQVAKIDGSAPRGITVGSAIDGDSAGVIRLTFSGNPVGRYATRGSSKDFRFVEDSLGTDLASTENTSGNSDGQIQAGALGRTAFIDSVATINANVVEFKYYVSFAVATRRLAAFDTTQDGAKFGDGRDIDSSENANRARFRFIRFVPTVATNSATTSPFNLPTGPTIGGFATVNETARGTSDPQNIRGTIVGDLGVVGNPSTAPGFTGATTSFQGTGSNVPDLGTQIPLSEYNNTDGGTDDLATRLRPYTNLLTGGIPADGIDRFALLIRVNLDGNAPASSFPDMIVNSVKNAASKTVSAVKNWWNRITE